MDLPNHIFDKIKREAKNRNITITRWVIRAIIKELLKEELYK